MGLDFEAEKDQGLEAKSLSLRLPRGNYKERFEMEENCKRRPE